MAKYQCAHCGMLSPLGADEWLDSGTVLICDQCKQETVVDLFRPEDRTDLYTRAARVNAPECRVEEEP